MSATPGGTEPLLHLQSMRFRWPGADRDCVAIDEMQLAPGETVFVRGPSGCGKSTLLSLVAGVLTADSGRVMLLGRDWKALRPSARDRLRSDHIGYIFQQFNLLPYLSVRDNVLLACRLSPRRASRAGPSPQVAADQLLEHMGLGTELRSRAAAQLSVGQQQRVAAARALIGKPDLVIADEPTSALDAELRDSFMRLLMNACREAGSALIFVSHDRGLAGHFDRQLDLGLVNRALATDAVDAGLADQT